MKKCLIVVDYQNDFVSGSLGFEKATELEQNIANKIIQYHQNGDEVMFTFDTHTHTDAYLSTQEGQNLPVIHCIKDTKGHALYGQVADLIEKADKRFYKNAFGSDEMYEYLKGKEYECIEIVGLVSNICVLSAAVLAKTAQPETPIIVDASCTSSFDDHLNYATLDVLSGLQVQVTNRGTK